MLAFAGTELPTDMARRLAGAPAAGVTLFRALNVAAPAQVRELCDAIQRAARAAPGADEGPVLVAADQEGGQLIAMGDGTTPFPGAMAIGATGDADLAERVGHATGLELKALGVNTAYAPVCDLADNPRNPHIGIRSFGSDPGPVADLVAATVRGLRRAGVAATGKHFPGLGGTDLDSHLGLGVVDHDRARLDAVELVPFRGAIEAGAELVMSAHLALPAITGDPTLPATLSRAVMTDLVRGALGFGGLTITDALDMGALPQGDAQVIDVIAAVRAGVDLLLCTADPVAQARIEGALRHAATRGLFDEAELAASEARRAALRRRLAAAPQPCLEVVRGAGHLALADEVARRAVTLVRDDAGILPLRLDPGARVVVVQPAPRDLTPADTSSAVPPLLADAVRRRHARVDSIIVDEPSEAEGAAVADRLAGAGLLVLGTVAAFTRPAEAAMARVLLAAGVPTVTVALRTPFELAAYPASATHACSYGILAPSCEALAAALFGEIPFAGRLPAPIPGLYPVGHGLRGGPTKEH